MSWSVRKFLLVPARAVLAALIIWSCSLQVQAEDETWVVPTELCRGYWFVPVALNEAKYGPDSVLHFIYDTGASATYIDKGALERLTGRTFDSGDRVRLVDASSGDIQFHKLGGRIRNLGHLSMAMGRPVDGILAVDTFEKFLLTLDPVAGEMSLARGNLPRPDGQTVFSTRGRDERPWLKVSIAGNKETLLVDSGAAGTGISINKIERFPLQGEPRVFSSSVRLSRIEKHSAARLDGAVTLAGLTFEEPVIEDVPGTQLLGGEMLQYFVMTLDQRKRRLSLRPTRSEPVPPAPRFELGMAYRPTAEGLLVTEIYENTPAHAAGLQDGDLVIEINGARPDLRGCTAFDQDGQAVEFSVRRNDSVIETTLVMKPVIAAE